MFARTFSTAALMITMGACTTRPLEGATEGASASSSGSSSSTDGLTTSDGPTTAQPTTSTSTSTSAETSEPGTSSTTIGDETTSATTTSGGPPSVCGPPCAETWEIEGNLSVSGWGDPPIWYSCLTAVHGDLTIEEDVPQEILASLANLRRVDGRLHFLGHQTAEDLDFLACLEETAWLDIAHAPKLTDLGALAGLRSAGEVWLSDLAITTLPSFAPEFTGIYRLVLSNNPALKDLGGAAAWGVSDTYLSIQLDNNAALSTLASLENLTAALGDATLHLQIIDSPALVSLTGLEPVTNIGDLWLEGLPQLTDLAPLAGLTSAQSLTLDDIPQLDSLADLGGLTSVGFLTLGNCINTDPGGLDGLTSLAGLDNLVDVNLFGISGNDGLTSLAGAPKLKHVNSLAVVDAPALSQAAYDAFLAQLESPPSETCLGPWIECQCFQLLPW